MPKCARCVKRTITEKAVCLPCYTEVVQLLGAKIDSLQAMVNDMKNTLSFKNAIIEHQLSKSKTVAPQVKPKRSQRSG